MDTADSALEAPSSGAAAVRLSDRPAVRMLARLAPWIITLVAGVVRFARLSVPHAIIPLDETYYAKDAAAYLRHATEDGFAVHPPVGKWMIAAGEAIFGYRPFGWRFAAAVVGTLSILLVYVIAKRLWSSTFAAVTASILLATDGLFFVQSRIAMLDIFLAFWILVAIWLLLEDRARAETRRGGVRWWRVAAGVAAGLAVSTKWSAAALLPMLIVIALAWEVRRLQPSRLWQARTLFVLFGLPLLFVLFVLVHDFVYRAVVGVAFVVVLAIWLIAEVRSAASRGVEGESAEPEETQDPTTAEDASEIGTTSEPRDDDATERLGVFQPATRQAVAVLATFALLPPLIYLGSYVPWFLSTKRYVPPRCHASETTSAGTTVSTPKAGVSLWLCFQREIFDYHKNLKATKDDGTPIHPYLSRAWSWPWIGRPAAHYFRQEHRGSVTYNSEIVGAPNPIMWWPAFFVGIPLLLWWTMRRDETAALILALFAPLYLPWLVTTRPLFMFYMTPAVPILALALTHAIHRGLLRWPRMAIGVIAYLLLNVAGFVFFYPVLAAYPITEAAWQRRMIFGGGGRLTLRGDCTSKFFRIRCWI